jgi:F420-dependent methylenetetrahydromethanopterin dehydrogenase
MDKADPTQDLMLAVRNLKRRLAATQCAVLDLHEAFVRRDPEQCCRLEDAAREVIDKAAYGCIR